MPQRTKPTAAEIEASQWVVCLDSPEATADDHRRFRAWLAADASHHILYEAMRQTWRKLDGLDHAGLRRGERRRRWPWRGAAAAAAIAASVLLGVLLLGTPALRAPSGAVSYLTHMGEQRSIRLEDGSTIELSPVTDLAVAYTQSERRVVLHEGTALFVVRSDSARPFIVETSRGTIRVRGTSFVIHVGETNVRATVLRGVVEGERRGPDILHIAGWNNPTVTARANEEIAFEGSRLAVLPVTDQVMARRLAWQDGMLAFDGETLREAAAEVTRQTGVSFEFAEPAIGDMRIAGYIPADADAFALFLDTGMALDASQITPTRIRLSRAEQPPL